MASVENDYLHARMRESDWAGGVAPLQREIARLDTECAKLRETIKRLNRRCQLAEAAANLKVDEWDKRSKGQGRDYVYDLARWAVMREVRELIRWRDDLTTDQRVALLAALPASPATESRQ